MIYPILHPTYNERHKKIIEMINWTLEKYKSNIENNQQTEEAIDNIIDELAKKKDVSIHKKNSINDYNSKVSIASSNLLIASFSLFLSTVGIFNIP